MESWKLALAAVGAVVGILGLTVPALVYLVWRLSQVTAQAASAHRRLDALEVRLVRELKDAWHNCPAAMQSNPHKEE